MTNCITPNAQNMLQDLIEHNNKVINMFMEKWNNKTSQKYQKDILKVLQSRKMNFKNKLKKISICNN